MGQRSGPVKQPAEQVVKEIRRATRRQFSAEEKIRIVLTGLRGRTASPSCAGARGLCRTSITVGRRNFWRGARNA